jgi:hypothetical protein
MSRDQQTNVVHVTLLSLHCGISRREYLIENESEVLDITAKSHTRKPISIKVSMSVNSAAAAAAATQSVSVGCGSASDENRQRAIRVEHLSKHRQYWRDIILGVNDGLVSTFLLVAGVAGSGLTSTDILLTAIAGALAGAVSMASGEFIATKSQNEVLQGTFRYDF